MSSKEKKLIYSLVGLIIFLAIILLVKIKTTPQYDTKTYDKIYSEYEVIFGKDDDIQKNDDDNIQRIKNFTKENKNKTANFATLSSIMEQKYVIGEIIIPIINIRYPIIKETTTEYLKIAPTKYCGPEVNEIRKFSYSRS